MVEGIKFDSAMQEPRNKGTNSIDQQVQATKEEKKIKELDMISIETDRLMDLIICPLLEKNQLDH